jgi:cytochrome c556
MLLVLPLAGIGFVMAADAVPPNPPPASTYAPADQLVELVHEYIQSMQQSVADEKAYEIGEARLKKEANTLACLALTLGLHDTANPLQATAPALYAAATQAAKVSNLQEAQAAVAHVAAVMNDQATDGPELKWERAGSLAQLMKQVTFVHARLKRGARPGPRFESQADESAKYATVLAVIGQAVAADTHEVKDPSEVGKWYQLCGDMRDAAGETAKALRARDPEKTEAALQKLERSCTDCHNAFRVEIGE